MEMFVNFVQRCLRQKRVVLCEFKLMMTMPSLIYFSTSKYLIFDTKIYQISLEFFDFIFLDFEFGSSEHVFLVRKSLHSDTN